MHFMKQLFLFVALFVMGTIGAKAQDFSYGVKTGLNFSTFNGPLETAGGNEVEEFANTTGFHVGAIFNLAFTDLMGVRFELLYSQKGARYRFDGPSYQFLLPDNGGSILTTGEKFITLNVTNSYIDVPVLGYVKATDWLEFSIGASVGLLANSTGAGELIYSGTSALGANIDEFSFTLEYNYRQDETKGADFTDAAAPINVDGQQVTLPTQVGAYYDLERKDGSVFNLLDIGLVGGISLFLNDNLFVGGRLNYGLTDISNSDFDFSRVELGDDNDLIPRDDKDTNLSIQASVGFSF